MNTNDDLRLALCESFPAVLDHKARYTATQFFRACMKQLHPMSNESLQNVWVNYP